MSVCLNHLPAFIFHFSSLPLSRGSLAVIILTLHISFPPSCSRMGLKEALIKAKTCSRKISIRHQLQGPVASLSTALTSFFPRTSFQSARKSELALKWQIPAPLEGLICILGSPQLWEEAAGMWHGKALAWASFSTPFSCLLLPEGSLLLSEW